MQKIFDVFQTDMAILKFRKLSENLPLSEENSSLYKSIPNKGRPLRHFLPCSPEKNSVSIIRIRLRKVIKCLALLADEFE